MDAPMPPLNPRAQLTTHTVTNQPPPFVDLNLFESDAALIDAVEAAGGGFASPRLKEFGGRVGAADVNEWAIQANDNPPVLKNFDRYGRRLDEVDFHPAYHMLMDLGLSAGTSGAAWRMDDGGHVLHAALLFLLGQADAGVCCPISMTYAAVPALQANADIAAEWAPRLTAYDYDARSLPASQKRAATVGMAMTEKQGGSDVRANTTHAERTSDGWRLTGHKWFCSAPMSDAFLTLAQTDAGLTCFLVPRWTPDGERNALHLMRLKNKLGDRSNASSEIEYHGALAMAVGEEGRGVPTIIEMVQHTRLDCVIGSASGMRIALANALWHAEHRTAFQKKLIDQPAMQKTLADLALDSEAATALAFRLASAFDRAKNDAAAAAYTRLATPAAKYWVCKRQPGFVYEALECHGGAGFIEESPMPRYYRAAPLNAVWEGSGNVIALDILRAVEREPSSFAAIAEEIASTQGAHPAFDASADRLSQWLAPGALNPLSARAFAEDLGLLLSAAALAKTAPSAVFEGYCNARLTPEVRAFGYGASPALFDAPTLLSRAAPF
ncbi:MAG: acyl-CoA dehydrogenase family protein [Pseudomonadota bacterium]